MNDQIGRCGAGGGSAHLKSLQSVRGWCDDQGVLFKVIVVVVVVIVVVVPCAPGVSVGGQGHICVDCYLICHSYLI